MVVEISRGSFTSSVSIAVVCSNDRVGLSLISNNDIFIDTHSLGLSYLFGISVQSLLKRYLKFNNNRDH